MGKDKLKRFAEVAIFTNVIEPTWDQAMNQEFEFKGKWNADYFKNDNPIVLELACGGGEYTVGLAAMYPNKNFIGVDIKGNRIWKGAKKAIENNLNNVGFLRTRIDFISNFFVANEISEIWITFPDPQPQSPRQKKRLTHPIFLNRYKQFLKADGKIRLKTDSTFLYEFTKEIIEQEKLTVFVDSDNIYEVLIPQQPESELSQELHLKTHYEKMWLKEGKKIKYLEFGIL